MLRGIYAPSDMRSINKDPFVTAAEKLAVINGSPVTVEHHTTSDGGVMENDFDVFLPYVQGGSFSTFVEGCLFTDYISVGDAELYNRGVGSRLLRSAVRYAIEHKSTPAVETFATGWARLGLVNTAVKVFGQDNVAVKISGEHFNNRYGWQGNKELEEIFDDKPPEEGKPYLVYKIEARIDRDQAMTWEVPVLKAAHELEPA